MKNVQQTTDQLIARTERALLLLAYFIELDGDVYLPLYEKFEAELELLKRKKDTRERARLRLTDNAHALKAMLSSKPLIPLGPDG